jgi:transcriptional regulator with XRE-family HTH domain
MAKKFNNIARLVKESRVNRTPYSQQDLSILIGYKNGQFISNIERGLCSLPLNKLADLAIHLRIDLDPIMDALLKDHAATIEEAFNKKFRALGGLDVSTTITQ